MNNVTAISLVFNEYEIHEEYIPVEFRELLLSKADADIIKSLDPIEMMKWQDEDIGNFAMKFMSANREVQSFGLFIYNSLLDKLYAEWSSVEKQSQAIAMQRAGIGVAVLGAAMVTTGIIILAIGGKKSKQAFNMMPIISPKSVGLAVGTSF